MEIKNHAVQTRTQSKITLLALQHVNLEQAIKEPVLSEGEDIPEMILAETGLAFCDRLFFTKRELKGLLTEERE